VKSTTPSVDDRRDLQYDKNSCGVCSNREVEVETSQQQDLAEQTDGDYVEFFRAGTWAKGVFQCVSCQWVLVTSEVLRPCPTCGEKLWERADWSPFQRSSPH
jgi:hypothetical protein